MAGRKRVRNPQSQADIVAAAERVVAREGAAHLTLDAVAKEAGISKGGLLYNFPSKEVLLQAMVEAKLHRMDRRRAEVEEALPDGPNRAVRALLALRRDEPVDRPMGLAILAAGAENPSLLQPVRERLGEMRQEIRSSSDDPLGAYVVWLAQDMLMMWDVLGVIPFEPSEIRKITDRLEKMAAADKAASD